MFGGDPEMDPQSRSSVQEGVDTSFQSDIFIGSEKSSENEWKVSCNTYPANLTPMWAWPSGDTMDAIQSGNVITGRLDCH